MQKHTYKTVTEKISTPCPRCNGEGRLVQYYYNKGGACFKCGGHGVTYHYEEARVITGTTPEYDAHVKAEIAAKKAEAEAEEAAWQAANPDKEWWERLYEQSAAAA